MIRICNYMGFIQHNFSVYFLFIFSYGTYFSRLKSSEIVFTTKLRAFHRH